MARRIQSLWRTKQKGLNKKVRAHREHRSKRGRRRNHGLSLLSFPYKRKKELMRYVSGQGLGYSEVKRIVKKEVQRLK